MTLIDLTVIPAADKHRLVFDHIKQLSSGQHCIIRSEQDPVVLLSHIIEEFGECFDWQLSSAGGDLYELIVQKI